MKDSLKEINAKLELLRVTHEGTKRVVDKKNITAIERQKKTIARTVEEIHELKVKVQEQKILKKEKGEEIEEWTGQTP